MKCPACNEFPSSFIHVIKMNGVGFKKSSEGFLKCKRCGQILKQKRHSNFFIVFEKKFYLYVSLAFAIFATSFLSLIYVKNTLYEFLPGSLGIFALLASVILLIGTFVYATTTLGIKHAIYELSNETELNAEMQVEPNDQVTFINFIIIVLLAGFIMFYFMNAYIENIWVFAAIFISYISVVVFTGIRLMKKMNARAKEKLS